VVQPQIQQVKIVVKDHTTQEDTLRLAAGVFQLGLNSHNVQMWLSQRPQSFNFEDIIAFNQFFFQMIYAQTPMSVGDQIQNTVSELLNLQIADSSMYVKNFVKPFSYADMRKVVDSLMANQDLQKSCLLNQFMMPTKAPAQQFTQQVEASPAKHQSPAK
jgi:hypothetical protein